MEDNIPNKPETQKTAENPAIEKEPIILHFLYSEGLATTSVIHDELLRHCPTSIQSTRKIIKELRERHGFIDYKELPTKGQGAPERAYSLTEEGMRTIGKQPSEIKDFFARFQRIKITQAKHYFLVRQIERTFQKNVQKPPYSIETYNEFNGDLEKLHIKLQVNGKPFSLRSDAHCIIYKNNLERAVIKLEADRGTEDLSIIMKKYEGYLLFAQSELMSSHSNTYPVYMLLIAAHNRILNIIDKLKSRQIDSCDSFLFLAAEKLGCDLMNDPVILDISGNYTSLLWRMEERDGLLTFQYAVSQAAKQQKIYDIQIFTKYSRLHDAFFPLRVETGTGTPVLWSPDGYIRIQKTQEGQTSERMFALVMAVKDEKEEAIRENLQMYETFLKQKNYRERVTHTRCCGCLVVVEKEERIPEVINSMHGLKIQIRIVAKQNCDDGILEKPVWVTEKGEKIALWQK